MVSDDRARYDPPTPALHLTRPGLLFCIAPRDVAGQVSWVVRHATPLHLASLLQLEDRFHFHARAERELTHSQRGAGVPAGFRAEHFLQ